MKTKKIAPGYHEFTYKGYHVYIVHTYHVYIVHTNDDVGIDSWYFTYTSPKGLHHGAEDWYSSKKIAIKSAIEWIDYLIKN
jgi:hypothetical protein